MGPGSSGQSSWRKFIPWLGYCYVVLIGKNAQTGKTERLTEGFRYHDTYTKKSGKWQISVRESEVLWAKTETVD